MINRLPKAKLAKPQKKNTEILDYRHKGAKRKNNPEEGLAIYLPEEKGYQKYSYDPHLDPQLIWSGKAERASFEVPVVPLHIHERVSPRSIVGVLEKKRGHQLRLFDEAEFPLDKRVDFYKHDMDWANRLILGDSLLVMNSLLTKEFMAGKVQMVYIDPPYGIKFASNFQSSVDSREVKDDDAHLTREPEQIKAYRDTWELGIHSYLTYLRNRLLLARDLLTDSGSIFVQISDENVHHVHELMDEIFGSNNFSGLIVFVKTSSASSILLPAITDYVLWYARNLQQLRSKGYHKLFKPLSVKTMEEQYTMFFDDKGAPHRLAEIPQENATKIPSSRRFMPGDLSSQGFSQTTSKPYIFQGKAYEPGPNRHFPKFENITRLVDQKRIIPIGQRLRYVRFATDFPYEEIDNNWTDTGISGFANSKIYVVQTSTKVIERCLLMTTSPGDLVLDPTCGSGTTAFIAEQYGRRWITCDTSRVAVTLARQRLLTAVLPYYQLAQPQEGVKSGFIYKCIPHITLKSIAESEPPASEILYDKPDIDTSAVRLSGPFTVEAIPAPSIELAGTTADTSITMDAENYVSTLIEAIRKSGVIFSKGKKLKLEEVAPITSSSFLHAEGTTSNGETRRLAVSFGPRYGPLSARQAEEAIRAATVAGYQLLILAGFQIDPAADAFVQRTELNLDVQFAHINPDMEIHDLLKQTQGSQLFSVFGEPDIELKRVGQGETYVVRLLGVDVYDPVTGSTEQTSGDTIPAWFLDEDYDGYSFNICQAFFPDGAMGKNPWDKLENALYGIIDKEKIEQLKSNESLPFELGEHKTIAVKVIDNRGNEVIKIRKLHDLQKV